MIRGASSLLKMNIYPHIKQIRIIGNCRPIIILRNKILFINYETTWAKYVIIGE